MKLKRTLCVFLLAAFLLSLCACGGSGGGDETASGSEAPSYEDFKDEYVDSLPENAADGLTLHAFNWTYREITANLESIKNAGFRNVLTMPVQPPKGGGASWWAFYQPLGMSIGDGSSLGTKEELKELCDRAEELGIAVLADIVANHLATTDSEDKEPDGTPTVSPAVQQYEPVLYNNRNEDTDGNGVTFHHNVNARGSGADTQYYAYGNLPDLNTSNAYVQSRVLSLLKECVDIGIDGFRFDAAKHIETSGDPDYPSDFWENTLEKAKEYYKSKTGKDLYVYGEILGSPSGRDLSDYTKYMRITDDGYAAQFKNAFASKDPSLILNASLKTGDAGQLIAWVESHDEYVTTNTHYSDVRVAKYWSIIAAKKGLGGLYLARPTKDLNVGQIGSYAFESEYVAVGNRFRNRFFDAESYESVDGTRYVSEKIKEGDQGALILDLGAVDPEVEVTVAVPHLEDGNYYDALTGKRAVVTDHKVKLKFEANGMAVLTRSRHLHPQLSVSERDCSFVGDKQINLAVNNAETAYYRFNNDAEKTEFGSEAVISLKDHVENGVCALHVYSKNGQNVYERTFTYKQVELIGDKFNVINLDAKYLNGDYELYIWSWSPGRWSRDYTVENGVMLVDTTGMTGFLIAVFEKGYEITDPDKWDPNVIKQSGDIKGEAFEAGFADLTGF
ncbi:MAG: hypothetical protein IJQ53_07450 [Clostridia bacterium]|nr:hypothetical protein [Clostridia bacterium]